MGDVASRYQQLSGRTDLARLLSDACIALLRRESDWNAVAVSNEQFGTLGNPPTRQAESVFQRLAVSERTKFQEETDGSSQFADIDTGLPRSPLSSAGNPTSCVVSLVVAVRGISSTCQRTVRSASDLKAFLQSLASDALSDNGENITGVELLWTPSRAGAVLTEQDVVKDYPELMRI